MAAPEAEEKHQDGKTDERDPGSRQITTKRLSFENRQPHPGQQEHPDRPKKQGNGLKNSTEIIRLLAPLQPFVTMVSKHRPNFYPTFGMSTPTRITLSLVFGWIRPFS